MIMIVIVIVIVINLCVFRSDALPILSSCHINVAEIRQVVKRFTV